MGDGRARGLLHVAFQQNHGQSARLEVGGEGVVEDAGVRRADVADHEEEVVAEERRVASPRELVREVHHGARESEDRESSECAQHEGTLHRWCPECGKCPIRVALRRDSFQLGGGRGVARSLIHSSSARFGCRSFPGAVTRPRERKRGREECARRVALPPSLSKTSNHFNHPKAHGREERGCPPERGALIPAVREGVRVCVRVGVRSWTLPFAAASCTNCTVSSSLPPLRHGLNIRTASQRARATQATSVGVRGPIVSEPFLARSRALALPG